ncbi:calcium/calmodulin-dependent 3',5'-cyclic nucleotide phosphodiesterase 1-like isoform X3 [Osmia bicornis bicornis]|uniref:calcium/calmodulin-dependent 3',5'-cyclic nucleotide phosphodiesterase 1-like isoform X3 n=1 Tax=Osmia bicornis bicornis TaxID=1437191 RepID=UPI0010F5488D|nr:calcium/calmodulin-dependent 3',5'-cyclic nucleotide phosphodiesterase 1-like isoform X3 [Osmia bicornis bicornis]XP_029050828.1 calcium/calmodulin-dependent 3',5'-cyclic nucleotide phosphodiesterase 1-like isoform X3 [Osmia bicornis bicornis]XP_029050834.1 calcium/calmodulin-dependent 3',5'-cyclic nucleotide phosphodiesterase 1-like isoform X3 [Osmia bicornis bicornis]XP_029050849.1 calcium/calmodulin-dependent 3',5'-cyclic nucleotide phosphodiesterase 1-like isoform X3 [Osmia bicornis bicor
MSKQEPRGPPPPPLPPPYPHQKLFKKCKSATFQLDGATYTIVASPPDRRVTRDDIAVSSPGASPNANATTSCTSTASSRLYNPSSPGRNGQLSKQGTLTIVRRSSGKNKSIGESFESSPPPHSPDTLSSSQSVDLDEILDNVDLTTDSLPAVDTPDACDKAALRLRCLLRQLQHGEISAELLQRNLNYAARVLEAVFLDETKVNSGGVECSRSSRRGAGLSSASIGSGLDSDGQQGHAVVTQKRKLRTPVWARDAERVESTATCRQGVRRRRLADEDDELSEVQPDAVPPEVREWLASTFTRQLATTRRKADEKPKFRSVAHAIRAGIFVDRIYRRVTNTALMQFPQEVVKVLKTLDDWSFDVFSLSEAAMGAPVKYLGYDLLNRYGMIHKFKVPPAVLECFLGRVEEGYCRHRNPYHNNLHAADVAQTMHYILCQTGLMNWLTDLEIFATLVAAIIHDYEHTGTTNNFHVMSGSETALLYNDRAVLENHHISASFRILKEDECNILQNLSKEEFREFRSLVIDMVLATDMSFHFQQLKNMKNILSLAEPSVDKSKAVSLVLHCCDISHPAKRWDLHHRWTMQLLEEFFRQGDKEKTMGLPFSPLCDRNNTLVAESQIGFIEFIVEPSMQVCSDMLETVLVPLSQNVKESVDESNNGSAAESRRIKIGKPWIPCLAENKSIWKEQAVRDAEARAQKEQEQKASDNREDSDTSQAAPEE